MVRLADCAIGVREGNLNGQQKNAHERFLRLLRTSADTDVEGSLELDMIRREPNVAKEHLPTSLNVPGYHRVYKV